MFGIISDIQPICERLNSLRGYLGAVALITNAGVSCLALALGWLVGFEQFMELMFGCFAQLGHKSERGHLQGMPML